MLNVIEEIVDYNKQNLSTLTDICKPLFDNFGFTSFGYTRIKNNSRRIILETNNQWLEYYAQLKFSETNCGSNSLVYNILQAMKHNTSQEFYMHSLSGKPNNPQHEFLASIDIWNCLSLYTHEKDFIEVFHFATNTNNEKVLNFFLNNKELCQRFFNYFHSKMDLLNIENAPCISTPEFTNLFTQDQTQLDSHEQEKIRNYLNETSTNKCYLKTHNIHITRREAECLYHLSLGKTFKEIARLLKISPRTIETHINTLKDKTLCHTKGELINIAHHNYLDISNRNL